MVAFALWIVAGTVVLLGLLPLVGTLRFRAYVARERRRRRAPFTPGVSVIFPCKGLDPGFEENVRSLIEQDYPDFEILFVTATEDDPARACLKRIIDHYPGRSLRLLVAGISAGRSQKLNNQLFACERIRPESEAFVFMDSDVRAHPDFLRSIVAPLQEEGIGATTGFRWYVPEKGGAGSYLRATWNGGGLPMLANPGLAYAWGGSMGILRETFERAEVARRWEKALTDDFPLTDAVRRLGLAVHFVPGCLLASHEDTSISDCLEWIICRVYNPSLWRGLFIFHAIHAVAVLLGAGLLVAGALLPDAGIPTWPAMAMVAVLLIDGCSGLILWATVRRLLPEIGGWRRAWQRAYCRRRRDMNVPLSIFMKVAVRTPGVFCSVARETLRSRTARFLDFRFGRGRALPPRYVDIKMTNRCNLRCRMCGQWGEKGTLRNASGEVLREELELPVLKSLADDVRRFKPLQVVDSLHSAFEVSRYDVRD